MANDDAIPSMGDAVLSLDQSPSFQPRKSRPTVTNDVRASDIELRTTQNVDETLPAPTSPTPLVDERPQKRASFFQTVLLAALPALFGLLLGLSLWGFRVFAASDILAGTSYSPGYTSYEFFGFAMNTYLIGFVGLPLMMWVTLVSKLFAGRKTLIAAMNIILAVLLLLFGFLSLTYWGAFWNTKGASIQSNNNGYVLTTGVGLWAVCLCLSVVLLWRSCFLLMPQFARKLQNPRTNLQDGFIIAFFLLVFLPGCFMLACLLPNWSLNMNPKSLFRKKDPNVDAHDGTCGKFGDYYWCVYYDVLIWYCFLYALCLLAILGKWSPKVQRLLSSVKYTSPPAALRKYTGFWSMGEVLLVLWFCGLIGATIWFWAGHKWQADYSEYTVLGTELCVKDGEGNVTKLQQWARIMGMVSNIVLSLLAMPTARSSVWSKMLGVSWEAMQKYHAALGYLFIWCAFIHQVLWWAFWQWQNDNLPEAAKTACELYDSLGKLPHDILAVPMRYHGDNYTDPLIIIVFWTMVLCIGVGAFYKIRRNFFEVFYYAHHVYIVVYIASLWHATSLWYFLISGLGLWFVDRLIRFSRGCSQLGGIKLIPIDCTASQISMIEVETVDGAAPLFEQGQYGFLNIPDISMLEWHPFTIASAPSDQMLRFYIKAMGEGTWTDKLHKLASDCQAEGVTPIVNYDGPYGLGLEYWKYKRVELVLGGIGITPGLSIMQELSRSPSPGTSARCVFILRDSQILEKTQIGEQINQWAQASPSADGCTRKCHCFLTRQKTTDNIQWKYDCTYSHGRPENLQSVLESGQTPEDDPSETLVFACGPEPVVDMADEAARALGYAFHKETFEL